MIESTPSNGIQSLTLSHEFNQPLESVRLPDSITYLKLGDAYNHPVERMHLPASLTHLLFGDDFRQALRAWDPPASLTHLILPSEWDHGPSQLRLPSNIRSLMLPVEFNAAGESLSLLQLPFTLHTLTLGGRMEGNDLAALTLPYSLTALDLGYDCDASLDDVAWPPHLTRLVTGEAFRQPLVNWSPPASLRELTLSSEDGSGWWNHPVSQLRLPSNLVKLSLDGRFNEPLSNVDFPPSLLSYASVSSSISHWRWMHGGHHMGWRSWSWAQLWDGIDHVRSCICRHDCAS